MANKYICPHCRKDSDKKGLCDYCKTRLLTVEDFNKIEEDLNKGNMEFYNQNFRDALNFYKEASDKLSNCELIYYYEALCHMQLFDSNNLMNECDLVLEFNPDHLPANVLKAKHFLEHGRFDKAFNIIDKLIDENPDSTLYKVKIQFLLKLDDIKGALECMDEAINEFPEDEDFKYHQKSLKSDKDEHEKFIDEVINDFGKFFPSGLDRLYDFYSPKEVYYFIDEKLRERVDSLSDDDLVEITKHFHNIGQKDISSFYLDHIKDDLKSNFLKATFYIKANEFSKSGKLLDKVLKKDKEHEDALLLKVIVLDQTKGVDKALEYYNKVIKNENEKSLSLLKDIYFVHGFFDESLECIEKLFEMGCDDKDLYYQKGMILVQSGNFDEANKLKKIIDSFEDEEEDYNTFDDMSFDAHDFDYIFNQYGSLLTPFMDTEELELDSSEKIISLLMNEQYEEALECLEDDFKESSDSADYYNTKAHLLNCIGKNDEALKLVNKGLEIDSEDEGAFILKAMILEDLEEYDEAIKVCKKGIEQFPNEYVFLIKLSQLYVLLDNNFKKAIEYIDKAIEIVPDDTLYELKEFYMENLKE